MEVYADILSNDIRPRLKELIQIYWKQIGMEGEAGSVNADLEKLDFVIKELREERWSKILLGKTEHNETGQN